MEKAELTALIVRAQSGDRKAMEEVLRTAHTSVSYQCRKLLRDPRDAEDMTQEVLLTVYTRLDSLKTPEAFWGWLNQTTANRCVNALKRNRVELQFAEDEEGHSVLDSLEELDEQQVPDKALDNAETTRMIEEIVDGLPEAQRICVLMYYYDEMSVKDIAAALGVPENTVKSRLNYARKAIKERVLDHEKKGIKLYSMSPLPLLLFFLRRAAEAGADPVQAMAMAKQAMALGAAAASAAGGAAGASAAGSTAAGEAAATGAAAASGTAAAGAAAASGTAAGAASHAAGGLSVKLIAMALAGLLAVGGIGAAVVLSNREEPDPEPSISETLPPDDTTPVRDPDDGPEEGPAVFDIDITTVPATWEDWGDRLIDGCALTINRVVQYEDLQLDGYFDSAVFDVEVGGGYTLDMAYQEGRWRYYSTYMDGMVLNGETMEGGAPYIDQVPYNYADTADPQAQYVFTCTEDMVGRPGEDVLYHFWLDWGDGTMDSDYSEISGNINFWLRVVPAQPEPSAPSDSASGGESVDGYPLDPRWADLQPGETAIQIDDVYVQSGMTLREVAQALAGSDQDLRFAQEWDLDQELSVGPDHGGSWTASPISVDIYYGGAPAFTICYFAGLPGGPGETYCRGDCPVFAVLPTRKTSQDHIITRMGTVGEIKAMNLTELDQFTAAAFPDGATMTPNPWGKNGRHIEGHIFTTRRYFEWNGYAIWYDSELGFPSVTTLEFYEDTGELYPTTWELDQPQKTLFHELGLTVWKAEG